MIEYKTKDGASVKAVPEEAFETTKYLLKNWKREAKFKKELAIADHDPATAEIKRTEENAFGFALQVLERLERYGEEDGEVTCSDN
jgi:predicted secreted Zn-dependent protease